VQDFVEKLFISLSQQFTYQFLSGSIPIMTCLAELLTFCNVAESANFILTSRS
jgi:hypothetical protein